MRATLADTALTRLAGRFVWLELDYDKTANRAFLTGHGVAYTPSLFVLDPGDERVTAAHLGGMTLPELQRFLDQGERGVRGGAGSRADQALARGDALLGRGRRAEASATYREALRLAEPGWRERPQAIGQLTWALMASGESQACAETAAAEAPRMARGQTFARVVLAGLSCASDGGTAPWAQAALRTLEPLAGEAVALPGVLRDHRFQLYQQLMGVAGARGDSATLARWGGRWLDELDATVPKSADERIAIDVARVDAVSLLGTPERELAALAASERAMPDNYTTSLRLAEVEAQAKHYDAALAACRRGLAHVTGPIGRTWLMEIEAEALMGKGDGAGARRTLAQAQQSAQGIVSQQNREHNIRRITAMLAKVGGRER